MSLKIENNQKPPVELARRWRMRISTLQHITTHRRHLYSCFLQLVIVIVDFSNKTSTTVLLGITKIIQLLPYSIEEFVHFCNDCEKWTLRMSSKKVRYLIHTRDH
ncbi:hypothetical protein T4B_1935 [Trichinella pseudospiralis]|uniref:Uncharacterized protein n=1 Tax=Trichinella pseudospiralis TaxID=6337 RepID=A0A0V1ECD7_TRIPS|nr:hypothetical protein T4A_675 [Trichinella pseudospiralis]KRZ22994.1 hypothetical protein T4B_1935 [Trichinella pseudospiralis]